MLKTKSLILDKGKQEDYLKMYQNVWSREEACRYMFWSLTTNVEEAKDRMARTIKYEAEHPYCYIVYLKENREPIGFAGMHIAGEGIMEEAGIALGPQYTHKGYGKEILNVLVAYAFEELGMKKFIYRCDKDNIASIKLAMHCGFKLVSEEEMISIKDGSKYLQLTYVKYNC